MSRGRVFWFRGLSLAAPGIGRSNRWTSLQPWSQSGGGSGGQGAFGAYMTPWNRQFQAPSAEDALNSPGLQFAMQQGQQGMERSAAELMQSRRPLPDRAVGQT